MIPVATVLASYLFGLSVLQGGLLVALASVVSGIAIIPGAGPTLYRTTGVGIGAWLLATAVAVGGIGLSYLAGDPRPFCEGVHHRRCLTPYTYPNHPLYIGGV